MSLFQIINYSAFLASWQKVIYPPIRPENAADDIVADYLERRKTSIIYSGQTWIYADFGNRWKIWNQSSSSKVTAVCEKIKKFENLILKNRNPEFEQPRKRICTAQINKFMQAIAKHANRDEYADETFASLEKYDDNPNEANFMELITRIFQCQTSAFSDCIDSLELKDEDLCFEIAKLGANFEYCMFAKNIQKYGITNQDRLFELAMTHAKVASSKVSGNIEKFNLTNPDHLFEIAKVAAEKNPYWLLENFDKYKIHDPNRLMEIAKIAVNCSSSVGIFLQLKKTFYLENPFEVLKIVVAKESLKFAECVKEFGITDENQLFELAKIAAAHTNYISPHIPNFNITNPDYLFEIAKIAATRHGGDFSKHLKNYKVTDPERLFTLAKIAARAGMYGMCEFIQNFNITDQDRLFEIAKLSTEGSAWDISENIQKFGIKNQERRFEIAKIAAKHGDKCIPEHIGKYQLNYEQRCEIALISVKQDPAETLPRIANYDITDFEFIRKIKISGFNQMCSEYHHFRFYSEAITREIFEKCLGDDFKLDAELEKILNIQELENKINSLSNEELKRAIFHIMRGFIACCKLHANQSSLTLYFKKYPKLLPTIFEERDMHVYWPLLNCLANFELKNLSQVIPEKQMVELLLNSMNIDNELVHKSIFESDIRNVHLRNPILLLLICLNEATLSQAHLNRILLWVFEDKDQIISRCSVIHAIRNLKGDLSVELEKSQTLSPAKILVELFEKLLPGLASDNLQNTFLKSRNPHAIFIYTGKIVTQKNEKLINLLTRFVNSVYTGNFKQVRQNSNSHLQFLQEHCPQTLKLFHQEITKEATLQEATHEPLHITIGKIIQKSLQDKHLTDHDFSKLDINFIPVHERQLNRLKNPTNLEQKIKELSQQKGKIGKSNPDEFKKLEAYVLYLKLQMNLIQLMSENTNEAKYNECHSLFQKVLKSDSEFLNDLKLIGNLFKADANKNERITLINSDDPYDILLCGTEVEGSCQRINGSALNSGLLGYLLNGQTRLLIAKVIGSETIKARAIMRLLVDANKNPVLFLERIYPQTIDPAIKNALASFAKEIAQAMNIPVLSIEVGTKTQKYSSTLRNLGTQATEYVDAVHGLHDTYEINESYYL